MVACQGPTRTVIPQSVFISEEGQIHTAQLASCKPCQVDVANILRSLEQLSLSPLA